MEHRDSTWHTAIGMPGCPDDRVSGSIEPPAEGGENVSWPIPNRQRLPIPSRQRRPISQGRLREGPGDAPEGRAGGFDWFRRVPGAEGQVLEAAPEESVPAEAVPAGWVGTLRAGFCGRRS